MPAQSDIAVVVVDVLNPYDHEDAEPLAANAARTSEALRGLIAATADSKAELVYVNDMHGDFTATSKDIGAAAMDGRHPELIEPILPPRGTSFIQKVRHSAFYESALGHLLNEHGHKTIVLAGQVLEQCILYSALDAYVRGFDIAIAGDACAAIDDELGEAALRMMASNMRAEVVPAAEALDA